MSEYYKPKRIHQSTHSFSKKLIQKCKDVFKKRLGRPITDDEVNLYLLRLAALGMVIAETESKSHDKKL